MKPVYILVLLLAVGGAAWLYPQADSSFDLEPASQTQAVMPEVEIPVVETDNSDPQQNWLYPGLLDVFDHFLLLHEQSSDEMWQQFEQYCLPFADCAAMRDLFQRYLDYKAALSVLEQLKVEGATDLTLRLEQQQQKLRQFFSPEEIEILFSSEINWEQQAIARLKIIRDKQLSAEQKWQLLQQHVQQLPARQKQAIVPTINLRKVAEIETSFSHGNDAYNSYAAEFGPEVAQRLVEQQNEQSQWQRRVRLYQQAEQQLVSQFQDKQALEEAQQQLLAQSFSVQEQKRLRVYLSHPELLE